MNEMTVIGKLTTDYKKLNNHYLITISLGEYKISAKLFDFRLIHDFETIYIGNGFSSVIVTFEERNMYVSEDVKNLVNGLNKNLLTPDGLLRILVIVDMYISED